MPFRSKKKRFIFPCSLTVQLAEFIGSGKMTDTQTHQETSGKDKLSLQTNNPMVVDPSMKMAVMTALFLVQERFFTAIMKNQLLWIKL